MPNTELNVRMSDLSRKRPHDREEDDSKNKTAPKPPKLVKTTSTQVKRLLTDVNSELSRKTLGTLIRTGSGGRASRSKTENIRREIQNENMGDARAKGVSEEETQVQITEEAATLDSGHTRNAEMPQEMPQEMPDWIAVIQNQIQSGIREQIESVTAEMKKSTAEMKKRDERREKEDDLREKERERKAEE